MFYFFLNLDVNMVAEPKPHQGVINKVKQTPVSPRTDWDFYYNKYVTNKRIHF